VHITLLNSKNTQAGKQAFYHTKQLTTYK